MAKKTKTSKTQPTTPDSKTAPGYKVTVSGQYFVLAAGQRGLNVKFFRNLEFLLPKTSLYVEGKKKMIRKTPKADGTFEQKEYYVPRVVRRDTRDVVQHIIQRYYLNDRLREEFDDCEKFRTCQIMKIEETSVPAHLCRDIGKLAVADMTEAELRLYKAINDLNTTLEDYPTLPDMQAAVEMELLERGDTPPGTPVTAPEGVATTAAGLDDLPRDDVPVGDDDDPLQSLMS